MIYELLGHDTLTMPLLMARNTKDRRDRGEEGGHQRSRGRREGVCSCEIGAVARQTRVRRVLRSAMLCPAL